MRRPDRVARRNPWLGDDVPLIQGLIIPFRFDCQLQGHGTKLWSTLRYLCWSIFFDSIGEYPSLAGISGGSRRLAHCHVEETEQGTNL
ncbi:hypothetical protein SAY87_009971 [Trapa incisa]|uniref:Uncharacterized protein n=1 Tax=Trapa incisa TaxID=236973 RepID=A0AAN7GKT1_9MYRT|nr:hypothetical protein SAY87_009971 [Trapa incisa]